ncbi:hypothetical protein VIGAN_01168200, partial [Vigna angularis var. angularis]
MLPRHHIPQETLIPNPHPSRHCRAAVITHSRRRTTTIVNVRRCRDHHSRHHSASPPLTQALHRIIAQPFFSITPLQNATQSRHHFASLLAAAMTGHSPSSSRASRQP